MLVWVNARKDLRRRLRDPVSTTWLFLLPIALVSLLVPLFGATPRLDERAVLLVCDNDGSSIAGELLRVLTLDPFAERIETRESFQRRQEGRQTAGKERRVRGGSDARGGPPPLRRAAAP